jgi:uncharacterized protein YciI
MNMTEQYRREPDRRPVLPGATVSGDPHPRPTRPAVRPEPKREFTTYYAVRMDPGALWDPAKPAREQAFWDEHARYFDALFEAGAVVLGGPFTDRTGSMVVVHARDAGHVREMFRDDPWTVHDVLVAGEVKAWTIFLDGRDRRDVPARAADLSPAGGKP